MRWNAELGVEGMCENAWRWQSNNPYGYKIVEEVVEETQ
jgi:UDP-glucose 4-epimerase